MGLDIIAFAKANRSDLNKFGLTEEKIQSANNNDVLTVVKDSGEFYEKITLKDKYTIDEISSVAFNADDLMSEIDIFEEKLGAVSKGGAIIPMDNSAVSFFFGGEDTDDYCMIVVLYYNDYTAEDYRKYYYVPENTLERFDLTEEGWYEVEDDNLTMTLLPSAPVLMFDDNEYTHYLKEQHPNLETLFAKKETPEARVEWKPQGGLPTDGNNGDVLTLVKTDGGVEFKDEFDNDALTPLVTMLIDHAEDDILQEINEMMETRKMPPLTKINMITVADCGRQIADEFAGLNCVAYMVIKSDENGDIIQDDSDVSRAWFPKETWAFIESMTGNTITTGWIQMTSGNKSIDKPTIKFEDNIYDNYIQNVLLGEDGMNALFNIPETKVSFEWKQGIPPTDNVVNGNVLKVQSNCLEKVTLKDRYTAEDVEKLLPFNWFPNERDDSIKLQNLWTQSENHTLLITLNIFGQDNFNIMLTYRNENYFDYTEYAYLSELAAEFWGADGEGWYKFNGDDVMPLDSPPSFILGNNVLTNYMYENYSDLLNALVASTEPLENKIMWGAESELQNIKYGNNGDVLTLVKTEEHYEFKDDYTQEELEEFIPIDYNTWELFEEFQSLGDEGGVLSEGLKLINFIPFRLGQMFWIPDDEELASTRCLEVQIFIANEDGKIEGFPYIPNDGYMYISPKARDYVKQRWQISDLSTGWVNNNHIAIPKPQLEFDNNKYQNDILTNVYGDVLLNILFNKTGGEVTHKWGAGIPTNANNGDILTAVKAPEGIALKTDYTQAELTKLKENFNKHSLDILRDKMRELVSHDDRTEPNAVYHDFDVWEQTYNGIKCKGLIFYEHYCDNKGQYDRTRDIEYRWYPKEVRDYIETTYGYILVNGWSKHDYQGTPSSMDSSKPYIKFYDNEIDNYIKDVYVGEESKALLFKILGGEITYVWKSIDDIITNGNEVAF